LTGLGKSVLQIKTKNVSYHTADSKPVKQEVNSTVILPPLVFPVHHITKIDCIKARTAACLVYLVSTVNGCHKTHSGKQALLAGTKQSKQAIKADGLMRQAV
jgi:hypothetical protein